MAPAFTPDPGEAVAYCAHVDVIDRDRDALSRAQRWLSDAERARFDRYRHDGDRRMFLLGRVMARALVGAALGVAPDAWHWRDSVRGRPEIALPQTTLQFNLSHSAGLVACAIATGRAVGVDVESLRRRPVDRSLVRRYCSAAEADDIEGCGEAWLPRFLHYWTLKEAYLKARGVGVSVPLAEIEFRQVSGPGPPAADEAEGHRPTPTREPPTGRGGIRVAFLGTLTGTDDRWAFALVQPTADHILAVAAERRTDDVSIALRPMPLELLP